MLHDKGLGIMGDTFPLNLCIWNTREVWNDFDPITGIL